MTTATPTLVTAQDRNAAAIGRGALLGGAAALVADLAIWGAGRLTTPVQVVTGWAPGGTDVSAFEIVATVVLTVTLGAGLLAVLTRFSAGAFRLWAAVAVAVAVLSSVPLWGLAIGTGSKAALTLMHLATGAAAVAGQYATLRSRSAS
jgi:hypothetical protein